MTVRELIQKLYEFDGDAEVVIPCATGGDKIVWDVWQSEYEQDKVYLD